MAYIFPTAVNGSGYTLIPQTTPSAPPPMYPYVVPSNNITAQAQTPPPPPQSTLTPTGGEEKLVNPVQFKVGLKDEIRRFSAEATNFYALETRIRLVFNLSNGSPLSVKYTDEDGDLITVSSDAELAEAVRFAKGGVVRLTVVPSQQSIAPVVYASSSSPSTVIIPAQQPPAFGAPVVPSLTPAWRQQQLDRQDIKSDWKEKKAAWKETKKQLKQLNDSEKTQLKETVKEMKCQMKDLKQHLREQKIENRRFPKEGIMLARFVKDVSIPDNTEMAPGQHFVKTWRFRNESNKQWPAGAHLLFVGKECDRMGAAPSTPVNAIVNPQQEIEVSVPMIAPLQQGRYTAYFRLADGTGKKFGQRVWVMIRVFVESSGEEKEKK